MTTTLIQNGLLVTMNKDREIYTGDILIKDNKISKISSESISTNVDQVIDATDKVIIPGMIQPHVHLTQTLFRGQADDLELLDWLKNRIWPLEGAHTDQSNYISAYLGIAELIKGGTTSIIDMETVHHTEAALKAIYDTGYRAVTGKCIMDDGGDIPETLRETTKESIQESVRLLEKWHNQGNGRIKYGFAPRFAISSSQKALSQVRDLAREYGVLIHTHASENQYETSLVEEKTGLRNVKLFEKLGLTGEDLILAHCIWLNEEEMEILTSTGTKIVHCPSSNLKLASGIAKIPDLLKMGANVSLASDGAPCNNNMDMFVEMRNAALIHKAFNLDPTVINAEKVFEMATLGGAKAMGMEEQLGSIEEGKLADLAIVDLNGVHVAPRTGEDVIAKLVYCARATDVTTTIIDGKIVMEEQQLTTIDEEAVKKEANKLLDNQIKRAGLD
ncbi:5'-deoxyadenosine deaminase [Natranaerobius thermophilus]|uniref:5-methylthioadenosine/S-adenosylhomocysteine deaminase n=1 Tax=Natranaerobius thermophilus (strain ATCC BAA-1301 / DSM 18059 / JW/NM-WN-LF) TaxID=457570 RepID=B2A1J1_NATTJ|nr:5'-deoxyadenosine deaminase [Natranaerobius thermophilus]ACB84731.1 amidohydrolase [Natranaerobius thermophilus JW/NM-WN-LF]